MAEEVFVHMELQGPRERVVGFIEGVRIGAGVRAVWYCSEEGYALDSLMDTIKDRMGLESHVIMPRALAATVEAHVAEAKAVKAKVVWVKEVDYAELGFSYRCFSREVGAEIRKVIESHLPPGVRLESYEVDEDVAGEAEGVELYAPVHHYTLSGSGRYVGCVPGIFALAERLRDQDFIEPERVKFHHR